MLTYRNGFGFDLAPERLWDRIEQVDQFERWWPWLSDCQIQGNGLSPGSVLSGVVTPPLPYRMALRIELVSSERPHAIDATVSGDLVGVAALRMRPEQRGTWVDVAWTVEVQQPAMRLAARIGRPLLQWGHDRVVEMTVAEFRRRIDVPDGDGRGES